MVGLVTGVWIYRLTCYKLIALELDPAAMEFFMAKQSGRRPPPKCKAILICDQVIVEAGTGKVSVIGTFDAFYLEEIPSQTKPANVFLQFADGIGSYSITIEVWDLQTDEVIARTEELAMQFPQRLLKMSLILQLPALPIQQAGSFDLVVLADGEEVDRQQFHVILEHGEQADE